MAVEQRGLSNLRTSADALPVLQQDYIVELFKRTGVLSPVELTSRYDTYAEQYILSIEVEAKLVVNMAKTIIYPSAIKYLSDLTNTIAGLKEVGIEFEKESAEKVAGLAQSMLKTVNKLSDSLKNHEFSSTDEHMQYCSKTIRPLMDEVRTFADALESEVADELWALPTYQEMLFIK